MTEDQLEQECLAWLADVGWQHRYGPDIAPDGDAPERDNYRQVLLLGRLRTAVAALNPTVPAAAREDAIRQVLDLGTPVLLAANRHCHRLLVGGVPVQYQKDGETRGDFARLVDWANPASNDWLAVNQFSVKGARYTRRPDIVLLPLVAFDAQCFRLGYGGGFFDRTLASISPRPVTVGVSYSHGFLPLLLPTAQDFVLDAMLTEDGVSWQKPLV